MSTPASLENTPFTNLGDFSYEKVLNNDYTHKKLGTLKLKATTSKDATVNYKEILNVFKAESKEKLSLTDELKIGFPYQGYYLQTRVKRNGDVRLHVDAGSKNLGKEVNLFGNIKTSLQLNSFVWRLGFNFFGKNLELNSRLERDQDNNHLEILRAIYKQGKFEYGLVGAANLNNMSVCKYDAFVSYNHGDWDFSLQHLSPPLNPSSKNTVHVGSLLGAFTYRIDGKKTVSLAVRNNFKSPKTRVQLGGKLTASDSLTLRGKIDDKFKLAAGATYKINSNAKLSGSAQLNISQGKNAFDFTKTVPFPLGFTLDLGI